MSAPVVERALVPQEVVAPQEVDTGPRPGLLVPVADGDDLVLRLAVAADQARTEQRPVLVAIVEPPRPLTIDAAVQLRHERRRENERAALVAEALEHCAGVGEVGFAHLEQPWALTRAAARRAVLHRAQRLARRSGHVLFTA